MSKKSKNIFFTILLLAVLAIILFFVLPSKTIAPANNQNATSTVASSSIIYSTKNKSVDNGQYHYSIQANYPVFSLNNGSAEKKINNDVAALIDQDIINYQSSYNENGIPVGDYGTSTFNINFSITSNDRLKNILAIKFQEDYYSAGAAHPGSNISTANYDLQTGNRIKLPDLFRAGSQYLEPISSYSIDALKKKLGAEASVIDIESGAGAKEDNFNSFLITDKGLLVLFNEYQVAPYAAGIPEVIIPWSILRDILNPSLNLI